MVTRFREIVLTLDIHNASDKDWREIRRIMDQLEKGGIEIVHTEIGKSIRVWLLCRTYVAVSKLQKMMKGGRLEDILIRLFSILLKREVPPTGFLRRILKHKGRLKMKVSIAPEQFLQAQEYFDNFGNQVVIFFLF